MADKIFLNALNKEKTDRPPFWFMRQAGRYLPEYRELRAEKGGFLEMAFDPKAACEVTMQPLRRFNMDAAIIFSDILTVPYALGQDLSFVAGEGPKLPPIRDAAGVRALNYGSFQQKLNPVYEALSLTRSTMDQEGFNGAALIGFCGAPWTVASYMVEGGSSKDFINVKRMMFENEQAFASLIDLLAEASAAYLIEQIKAGAEAVQIFDSWAGVLDVNSFNRWVVKPTREIVRSVRASFPNVPIIGFPKGCGYNYLPYVNETGVSAVGLDPAIDTRWAARVLQPLVTVQGNLDPISLLVGGDQMKMAAERIISDLSAGPFVFNLGHGVHKDTPPEHMAALVEFVRGH